MHLTIYLPDLNPSYFRTYASFICSNTLQMPSCERCTINLNGPKKCVENFWRHCNGCYELGWKLEDTPFRNGLIDVAIWQMVSCDEMHDSFHEMVYGNIGRRSMHRMLVLNLAFNTWEKSELKRVEVEEFRDDMFRYLVDAMRADGLERRGVMEVLMGLPWGVYWEGEGGVDEESDGDGESKVEGKIDVGDYEDRTGIQDYTKAEDYTGSGGSGDETGDTAETEVAVEIESKTEANFETKQESESNFEPGLDFEVGTEYFPGM